MKFKVGDKVVTRNGRVGYVRQTFAVEYPDLCKYSVAFPDTGDLLFFTEVALTPADSLQALWDSTANLYARFGLVPIADVARRVFMEEVGEFMVAHVQAQNATNVGVSQALVEEAADVLVTTLGMLMAYTQTPDALRDAIQRVIAKNDAKTLDTHEVNSAGKIARKS